MIRNIFASITILSIFSCRAAPQALPSGHNNSSREIIKRDIELNLKNNNKFRDNPNDEGGNENNAYEPSEYIATYRPIWMTESNVAHICIIAIIACDRNFNKSNWDSFFHGIPERNREMVKNKVIELDFSSYLKILADYTGGPHIDYEQFRKKVLSFQTRDLRDNQ